MSESVLIFFNKDVFDLINQSIQTLFKTEKSAAQTKANLICCVLQEKKTLEKYWNTQTAGL